MTQNNTFNLLFYELKGDLHGFLKRPKIEIDLSATI